MTRVVAAANGSGEFSRKASKSKQIISSAESSKSSWMVRSSMINSSLVRLLLMNSLRRARGWTRVGSYVSDISLDNWNRPSASSTASSNPSISRPWAEVPAFLRCFLPFLPELEAAAAAAEARRSGGNLEIKLHSFSVIGTWVI